MKPARPRAFAYALLTVVAIVGAIAAAVHQRQSPGVDTTRGAPPPRPSVVAHAVVTPPPTRKAAGLAGAIGDAQLAAAAAYAQAHGYTAGLCVIDTKTGATYRGGADELYSTESVSKLFIAARLLVEGEMTGTVADTAYKMITQSDDDSANALYGMVGADGVFDWIEQHYDLAGLGTGPAKTGWWGLMHVHPTQLAALLVKLRHDPAVWPWLGNAMAHAMRYASDGFDQSFGLRQVDPHAAIKQGWEHDYSLSGTPAQLNTTGYVDDGRYAVVIMVRGPSSTYFAQIAAMVTHVTRLALTGKA